MIRFFCILIFFSGIVRNGLIAQTQRFVVSPVPFSSRIFDEFSPVFFDGGLVFTSNQNDNSLMTFSSDQNRLFKIFYIRKKGNNNWGQPRILANEVTTSFNDGPATFNEPGNLMYFTRNNSIANSLKNISDSSNKLGIYSAEFSDGKWKNIKPFRYNNPLYSLCTPSLAPDGGRIYFASDMPGGSGGMDLYYCNWRENDWDKPVNMGPVINTGTNESFPFACKYRKVYFASDGHKGFGKKDLFYSQEINGEWSTPVHLDSAINSSADDFGIVPDSTFNTGYFSTNRRNTDDIFSFSTAPVEFGSCDSIRKNNYCFTFYDEKHRIIDTIPVTYNWDFGDGVIHTGTEVRHCFPGAGHYTVKLNIIDDVTGDTIAKQAIYKVDLENYQQALINSPDTGIEDKPISFEGVLSDLKNARITDLFWNFGEGFKQGGSVMSQTFKKRGEYTVSFGLVEEKDSLGVSRKTCVMKKIKIK